MTSIEKKARRKRTVDRVLIFMHGGFVMMFIVNYFEYVRRGRTYCKHIVQMFLLTFLFMLVTTLSNAFLGPGNMLLTEYFEQVGLPWLWIVHETAVSIPCSYVIYRFHSRFMKRRFYWWLDSL